MKEFPFLKLSFYSFCLLLYICDATHLVNDCTLTPLSDNWCDLHCLITIFTFDTFK